MNVFQKITFAALKKNKARTVATIVGIILSAAMICAVTTSVATLQSFLIDYTTYQNGDWHGNVDGADGQLLSTLQSSDKLEKLTHAKQMGYALVEGCTNPDKPYLYILGTDKNFESMMPIHLTDGKYPTAPDEILLPEHLLSNGGVAHAIGDTLTLDIGDRVSDGYLLGQSNPFQNSEKDGLVETLEVRKSRTYTVVGFYERPGFEEYYAPGYTAITIDDGSAGGAYDVYFKMEKPSEYFDFINALGVSVYTHDDLLMFSGVSAYPEFGLVLYGIAGVIIALILFGSVALIYNSFSISVSERTRQFGLLSSVGATKSQIRKMVLFEALVVGTVGTLLGVLAGIGGMAVTFHFVGDLFTGMGIPKAIPLRLVISWQAVLVAVVIALGTVLLSVWIPALRATRVTAIDAIRQSRDIKLTGKNVKTSKLTYRLFGLSGVIASKHFKRNRKKYRTTVISLFMSVVLFVSASAFVSYTQRLVDFGYGTFDYDLIYFCDPLKENQSADDLLSKMKEAKGVTNGTYYYRYGFRAEIPLSHITEDYAEDYLSGFHDPDADSRGVANLLSTVMFVEDGEYRRILKENGLEEEKFLNAENPLAVAFDLYQTYSDVKKKYVSSDMLATDELTVNYLYEKDFGQYYVSEVYEDQNGEMRCRLESFLDEEDVKDLPYDQVYSEGTMEIGAVLKKAPYFVETSTELILLYPASFADHVLAEWGSELYINFVFQSEDHTASFDEMGKILSANGMPRLGLEDYAALAEDSRNMITVVNVFSYGFILLISLIAATNVFNTVSTGIMLRRREFAMLKSVGMTEKGLNKMMNYECLLYGMKALLYGLPVSCAITYLIYSIVSKGIMTAFYLPWGAIAIATCSVFLVVFVTMLYAMGKIKKENPIDALKNENI